MRAVPSPGWRWRAARDLKRRGAGAAWACAAPVDAALLQYGAGHVLARAAQYAPKSVEQRLFLPQSSSVTQAAGGATPGASRLQYGLGHVPEEAWQ